MAQIKNPDDGNQRGKVTIVGYSERFFLNAAPTVHIMHDLSEIGKVEKNGKIEIDIDKESRIVFKCNQCTCRFSPCVVKPGDWVVLIYDRAVDSMLPIITDEANHMQAREEYYKSERIRRRKNIRKFFLHMLMVVLILCAVAGGIYAIHVLNRNAKIARHEHNRKVELAETINNLGFSHIEDPDAYTIEELEQIESSSILSAQFRRIEREKEERANAEYKERMREISSHPWKRVIAGDPYGKCILEVLYFKDNGQGTCCEVHYSGGHKVITPHNKPSSFDFSYYIDGEKVICEGTWEYVFKGGKLYDKENHLYKEGANLMYY